MRLHDGVAASHVFTEHPTAINLKYVFSMRVWKASVCVCVCARESNDGIWPSRFGLEYLEN